MRMSDDELRGIAESPDFREEQEVRSMANELLALRRLENAARRFEREAGPFGDAISRALADIDEALGGGDG